MLETFLNKTSPQDLTIKLYNASSGKHTEISSGGYSSIELIANEWDIIPGSPTKAIYPQVTFVFDGKVGDVDGYFIVQNISGKIMWGEKFTNGPFNIQNKNDEIKVTPSITFNKTNNIKLSQ